MHRLFVGLRPSADQRRHLLALMHGIDGARWQDEEQLHLTLRFIGEVERPQAEDIAAMLSRIAHPALTLRPAGTGRFETRGRVHAVWAGVAPTDMVAQLHRKIDRQLVQIGLVPERRAYLPHITLARMNLPEAAVIAYLKENAGFVGPEASFDRFLLYQSHLGSGGARYEVVASYPLG